MKDELLNIKRQRIMQRAHQIAWCIKRYQQPAAKYCLLFAEALRQAYKEWALSVKREALRLYFQNEYGFSKDKADIRISQMSDYQINLGYNNRYE
jgi:hypothetical protein